MISRRLLTTERIGATSPSLVIYLNGKEIDMTTDPTRGEMLKLLDPYAEEEDEIEAAIYYFSEHYHGGQFTNLYSVLSTSPFTPGIYCRIESEGDLVKEMYRVLEREYR